MDLNQKLLTAFQIEHVEHLEAIRSMLARLEQSGLTDGSALAEAFRCAHSLKGAARITGLTAVELLAHRLESLFARLSSRDLAMDKDALCVVQVTVDALEDCAAASLRGECPEPPRRVVDELDRILGTHPAESPRPLASPPPSEESGPRESARPFESVRLSAESLDRLLQSSGQFLTASIQQDLVARELQGLVRELAGFKKYWEALKRCSVGGVAHGPRPASFVPGFQRLEIVDHQLQTLARRTGAVAQLQQRNAWSHRLLANQWHADVCRARMVPAESVFQGFRRMMRDLAQDQGKQLEFQVRGLETEADREVLQALKDPLMHVLRNAVSHGIELPDERKTQGKPLPGRVSLRIESLGNRLAIVVEDDGRGVDLGRAADVAVRSGLGSAAEVQAWSPQHLLELLTRPGFSTCETVTELAGRGLGLSIAADVVNRLQGALAVRPRDGGGTAVSLTVPLAVSTHRLLLVLCGGQTFGIPLAGIETVCRANRECVERLEGRPLLSLHGQLTPIVSLAQLLDLAGAEVGFDTQDLPLVLLKSDSRRIAVAVEGLLLERDAVIQRLAPPVSRLARFLGGILQEDGSVSLVLNPTDLIERSKQSAGPIRVAPVVAEQRPAPTILVVDDSFTTRTLETNILESNGYRVRVAVDGAEALERLRAEHVDLVISDVQMPRLDGFGLLEEVKHDARLAHVPVIIVSSLDRREDRQRGLSLGADAYIVKRRFDHQELLQTIEQLV